MRAYQVCSEHVYDVLVAYLEDTLQRIQRATERLGLLPTEAGHEKARSA